MAESWRPPLLWIGQNYVHWNVDLSLFEAADLMKHHCCHDVNEIRNWVLPALRIEGAALTDEEKAALADDSRLTRAVAGSEKARKRRAPVKGLAFELIAASILRHFDRCPWVIANCSSRSGNPNGFAPPGYSDVTAIFPRTRSSMEFAVIAEVSAKREATRFHFLRQIAAAYKHALKEAEAHPGLRVYCLLVNGAEIFQNKELHDLYLGFHERKSLTADSDIRIVPFYSLDFAALTGQMAIGGDLDKLYCEPWVIRGALDAISRRMLKPDLPEARNWMIDTFLEAVGAEKPKQETVLDEADSGPERP